MPQQKATHLSLPDLPVLGRANALREALANGHVVLTAEPGSGKTTLAPLLLRDETWLAGRKILMLEPRRPAARMAARRMAALLDEAVGETVGYQVRFDRKSSADTRIEVLTEGLLLRRLQQDPEINDVGLVIFDEFHERSLQGDLLLALCMDVAEGLRNDLRLLVMSASLDSQPLQALLPAVLLNVEGRTFPVTIHQATHDADLRNPVPACLASLQEALAETADDVLVFLPGRREIEYMCEQVRERWGRDLAVMSLYGELPPEQQDLVIQGNNAGRRRVIVATDIAETSLTIEGVGAVVDSGLARKPMFDPNTGLTRLTTRWISKASALQRAGRAGRLGPGKCFRAWSKARQDRLDDWAMPEINRADLMPLVLELANWGVGDADSLRWLDQPPDGPWRQASEVLRYLNALDVNDRITALGRNMVGFPTHPRLAHLLASASNREGHALAADIAALLSERDPLRGSGKAMAGADIGVRLDLLANYRSRQRPSAGEDKAALRQIDQVSAQFLRMCPSEGCESAIPDTAECIAAAYPERVAICTSSDGRRYLMRNGRAASLNENDPLRGSPWLAIADVDAGQREGRIRLAASLSQVQVERLFTDQIVERREVRWDSVLEDVVARSLRQLGAIMISDMPCALADDDPVAEVLFEQIRLQGLSVFFDDKNAVRERVELMRSIEPEYGWPDFSDQGLLGSLDTWLSPWLKNTQGVRQLRMLDFGAVLDGILGWERSQSLTRALPLYFETPAGTRRRVQYSNDGPPALSVPLQEMLSVDSAPKLAGGRVVLLIHLLSPANRVLQVTNDLAGFWAGAYDEVKKEMRGRYPKHYWPDDPLTAKATRFSKRRMSKH